MAKLHFMGIGGVGMAGVACLLRHRGEDVTGCDKYASPRTQWLEKIGIPVAIGHDPRHIDGTDTLIVTPAVPPSAPELQAARNAGLTVRYRGEVLAELVNAAEGIAVCGTHGKTTTSTFIAKLLRALGEDPSWCIGGETGDFPVAHAGGGPLVVEADESDGTLALYRAHTLVVMNMDWDHPEHFKTLAAYRACYQTAIDHAQEVIRAEALDPADWPELGRLVLGAHNRINARTAIEVALRRGHSADAIRAALPHILSELPDRRFQTIAETAGFRVITDYAHHPRELACALEMALQLKPKRLRVLFQPHRYTRTQALLHDFPPAFAAADEIILIPVYAAFEAPLPGGDIADLYAAFRTHFASRSHAPRLLLARTAAEAWQHVFLTREPGDLIMLMGAGDIIGLVPSIQADVARESAGTPSAAIPLAPYSFFRTGGVAYAGGSELIIGQGSNTWFPDCAIQVTPVHAPTLPDVTPPCYPAAMPGARLGIAWMTGIPGTLGGWVHMNAGAFGHAIGELVDSVTIDGHTVPAAACGFGYRTSSLNGLVTSVTFKPEALAAAQALDSAPFRAKRKAFPPRTCGSVFKNPPHGLPAGALLEQAGAKALRVGGARVWEHHANVIVAEEGCTSSDILALARLMALAVRFKFGIALEPEIRGLDVS